MVWTPELRRTWRGERTRSNPPTVDATGRGLQQCCEHLGDRGLARAVRTMATEAVAGAYGVVLVVDGDDPHGLSGLGWRAWQQSAQAPPEPVSEATRERRRGHSGWMPSHVRGAPLRSLCWPDRLAASAAVGPNQWARLWGPAAAPCSGVAVDATAVRSGRSFRSRDAGRKCNSKLARPSCGGPGRGRSTWSSAGARACGLAAPQACSPTRPRRMAMRSHLA